ncbi:hypothetical protein MGAST_27765 [Mycobacterium gastri 'Wayne']|nr:hypothetical protein MGAST_27765 [Mycobacterium gastri 'Wayne']
MTVIDCGITVGRGPGLARRVVCDQGADYGRHRARRCRKQ